MTAQWIAALKGSREQKKRYQQDQARIKELPEPYAIAAQAMHRYITYYSGTTDGDTLVRMSGDLADLWERAAVDETPVRAIVGNDPVDFTETFAQAYTGKQWIDTERARLARAIDAATGGHGAGTDA